MKCTARRHKHVDHSCRAVIDDDYPVRIEAVGGQENRACEVSCEPGDEGLTIGAPGRQGTDPHGDTRFATVSAGEKPFAVAMRVVRDGDESAMAGEGVAHA